MFEGALANFFREVASHTGSRCSQMTIAGLKYVGILIVWSGHCLATEIANWGGESGRSFLCDIEKFERMTRVEEKIDSELCVKHQIEQPL